jgi:hypothetical protein
MKKPSSDQVEWTEATAFETYGVRIGIRVNDPTIIPRVISCLPPVRKNTVASFLHSTYSLKVGSSDGTRRTFHSLYCGSEERLRTQNLEDIFAHLEHSLEMDLAIHAKNKIFVHAGVVGCGRDARAPAGECDDFGVMSYFVVNLLRDSVYPW